MNLVDFHFLRPLWLIAVPFVIGIWWTWRQWTDPLRGWQKQMDVDLLAAMEHGKNSRHFFAELIRLSIWLIAVVALAGPTCVREPSPFADDPIPVMIVLSAAESMNNQDLIPSRMERARLKAQDFANTRSPQPVGLVVYSGSAHLVLPPTRDTAVVAQMASELSPEVMPLEGSQLGSALQNAKDGFGGESGPIVLIADSMTTKNLAELKTFQRATSIPIEVLGIGREKTPEMDRMRKDLSGIAGFTILTADTSDIDRLIRRTSKRPASLESTDDQTRWKDFGLWLLPLFALYSLFPFVRTSIRSSE